MRGLNFRAEVAMFGDFSERAGRIVFFSRVLAGRRGASAIELEDLIEALVLEDQAEYPKMFAQDSVPIASPAHRPFLAAEVAAEIQRGLEPLMPTNAKALPTSADMPLSEAAQRVLMGAKELKQEMCNAPAMPSRIQMRHVEPLHLLAVALSEERSATTEVLRRAGLPKDAVIAAIKSGEYS
jgi:hypothetical protein